MNYKNFINFANEHYQSGGILYVDWSKEKFDDYTKLFGEITELEALKLFDSAIVHAYSNFS